MTLLVLEVGLFCLLFWEWGEQAFFTSLVCPAALHMLKDHGHCSSVELSLPFTHYRKFVLESVSIFSNRKGSFCGEQ